MDLEHFTHRNHSVAVLLALVLSAMLVVIMSFLIRGTLNLKGALISDDVTDVVVINVVEPKLTDGIHIDNITFLRKADNPVLSKVKPVYSYLVQTSDSETSLAVIIWNADEKRWVLQQLEKLH